jgi:hypothetical protein
MSYRDMARDAGYDPDSPEGQQLLVHLETQEQEEALRYCKRLAETRRQIAILEESCGGCPLWDVCTDLKIQCQEFTENTGLNRVTLEPQT